MLNNAWPSLIWHLYDYYLQPAGGYFGAKKACEPLHVQYSYHNRSVEVVNNRYEDVAGLKVTAVVYDLRLQQRYSRRSAVDVGADAVATALTLPADVFGAGSPVYFVELELENGAGQQVSTNFYWISAKKTVYDWSKTTYRFTPASSYEDLRALQSLGKAESIRVSAETEKAAEGPSVRVKIANRGDRLAFQLHLGIGHKGEEAEIAPALWQDNYIELMPGESREIRAQFLGPEALNGGAELRVSGWNVAPITLALQPPPAEPPADRKR
jgi:exo-1,4-beta-D-glucosaminidase